ncbi:MAG: hypothetical protein D6689_04500 [Deltaproteobacteria bacterium]|nr:MAG: hypothetical protein D6689_04500 [Deltaproteobacteria bacterium]
MFKRLWSKWSTLAAAAALLLALAVVSHVVFAQGEMIPASAALAYRGTLEQDGVPFEGTATVTLRLFATATMEDPLCETQSAVTVSAGRFSLELPDACTDVVRTRPDAWVVATVDAGDGPQLFPPQRLHAVPYAVSAANGVPIGGIVPSFLDPATDPLPPGFEVCDGTPITKGPLAGRNKPDLQGRFLRGVTDGEGVGTTGGADTATTSRESHTHRWGAFAVDASGITYLDAYLQNGTVRRLLENQWVAAGGDYRAFVHTGLPGFQPTVGDLYYTQPEEVGGEQGHAHTVDVRPAYTQVVFLCRVY